MAACAAEDMASMRADIAAVDENRNDFTDGLRKIDVCRVRILPCTAFLFVHWRLLISKILDSGFRRNDELPRLSPE
jgi:hypothetical protein